MSDKKPPTVKLEVTHEGKGVLNKPGDKPTDKPTDKTDKKDPTAEEAALARIQALQDDAAKLEREIKIAEGKLANRNPQALSEVRADNAALDKRMRNLKRALFALLTDLLKPRFKEDLDLQLETLRQATIEFCQKANVDPEIWKNIAS